MCCQREQTRQTFAPQRFVNFQKACSECVLSLHTFFLLWSLKGFPSTDRAPFHSAENGILKRVFSARDFQPKSTAACIESARNPDRKIRECANALTGPERLCHSHHEHLSGAFVACLSRILRSLFIRDERTAFQ